MCCPYYITLVFLGQFHLIQPVEKSLQDDFDYQNDFRYFVGVILYTSIKARLKLRMLPNPES